MPRSRTFTNLKMGAVVPGAQGPQGFPANTGWFSSPVPCKGASMVIFRFKATDVNPFQSASAQVGNDPNGNTFLAAQPSNGYNVRAAAGVRMDRPGGVTTVVVLVDPMARFLHDYCQVNIISNLSNPHTGFTCDAEVFYDGDVNDAAEGAGQMTVTPV